MIYAETHFDKAVDDALEEMSRKENKTMSFKWDEPRNPFADVDFTNAMNDAIRKTKKALEDTDFSEWKPMPYDDVYPEYGGRMRLNYLNGCGAWNDVMSILIAHGYEVTAHTEVASEVEREVDGIEKWVVIEFNEVE